MGMINALILFTITVNASDHILVEVYFYTRRYCYWHLAYSRHNIPS